MKIQNNVKKHVKNDFVIFLENAFVQISIICTF